LACWGSHQAGNDLILQYGFQLLEFFDLRFKKRLLAVCGESYLQLPKSGINDIKLRCRVLRRVNAET
jgi:hypothetical protein